MTAQKPRIDTAGALPQMDGELSAPGAKATITLRRDSFGVGHVTAQNEHDAWFGQGYAAAQDRLWQMEFDRRRAVGRWAEAAGPNARFAGQAAVAADILARRMRIEEAAHADIAAMSSETREMFEAYAAGVNAFLESGQPLPVEYELCGIRPERWEPWHSVAVFKIRHVLMGLWQQKVAWGHFLSLVGPEAMAKLPHAGSPEGSSVILPPGTGVKTLMEDAAADIAAASETLGFLAELEGGSNSWVVTGERVTTGAAVLCNDSHRALDVPNAYWQVHVSCPDFDVIGATFAGVPGFPHFGYNGSVGWNITHTQADYQDLFIERFDTANATRYETPDGWKDADHREERIVVRGGEDVIIETWATEHGPIVHGDPRKGFGLALKYTATERPSPQWECLRPMTKVKTVAELHETQRQWVDPVNSILSADTSGNIGFLTRGRVPVRASARGRRIPAPGWTGENEWLGDVPFEQMPQSINPPEGYVGTANQRVVDGDEPYISDLYASPHRADRIRELLNGTGTLSPEFIKGMQGDRVSLAARAMGDFLQRMGPYEGDAEKARAMLAGFDGDLLPDRAEPVLYAFVRREFTRAIVTAAIGAERSDWLFAQDAAAYARLFNQWNANTITQLDSRYRDVAPDGRPWDELLPGALEKAWQSAVAFAGEDSAQWRWDETHRTGSRHPLSFAFPELDGALDPPRAAVGGDADTLQCAGYTWSGKSDFTVQLLSVYRQAIDFSDPDHASFVVPAGVSGLPGTAHYSDQLEYWRTHQRIPMHYRAEDVAKAAANTLTLTPG